MGTVKYKLLTLRTFGKIDKIQGDFMLNFYNKYVSLCNEKGVTPSRAALEMGLSKVAVSNWKSKRNSPTDANLQKIADYFGVTVEYLKGEEQEQKNPLTPRDERIDDIYNIVKDLSETDMIALKSFAAGLKANRKSD